MIKKTIGWILTVFGVLALFRTVEMFVFPSLHAALFSPRWVIDFFSALIGGAIGLTLGKKLRGTPKD